MALVASPAVANQATPDVLATSKCNHQTHAIQIHAKTAVNATHLVHNASAHAHKVSLVNFARVLLSHQIHANQLTHA